jgi:hypothetical protein
MRRGPAFATARVRGSRPPLAASRRRRAQRNGAGWCPCPRLGPRPGGVRLGVATAHAGVNNSLSPRDVRRRSVRQRRPQRHPGHDHSGLVLLTQDSAAGRAEPEHRSGLLQRPPSGRRTVAGSSAVLRSRSARTARQRRRRLMARSAVRAHGSREAVGASRDVRGCAPDRDRRVPGGRPPPTPPPSTVGAVSEDTDVTCAASSELRRLGAQPEGRRGSISVRSAYRKSPVSRRSPHECHALLRHDRSHERRSFATRRSRSGP